MPRRAAASAITPPACAVPITVRTFCWQNTRSIAIDVGMVGIHPVLDRVADGEQPALQRFVGGGADHVDVQRDDLPPLATLDDADSPQRVRPGIDSHHPHASPFVEQLFESLAGGYDVFRDDTAAGTIET